MNRIIYSTDAINGEHSVSENGLVIAKALDHQRALQVAAALQRLSNQVYANEGNPSALPRTLDLGEESDMIDRVALAVLPEIIRLGSKDPKVTNLTMTAAAFRQACCEGAFHWADAFVKARNTDR